ncbi:MAG TPA: alpha/beta fold hydrolase [Microbacteriaceae bacterium]|nr:alpha/beta fold hydrolase [Microbacteriaceae bacterium]
MSRGFFWLGSDVVETANGTLRAGQMYVEWEAPELSTKLPVVLIHGGGGQGTDYLGTPSRPGWAQLLVADGHPVYVVDRPGHGRSPLDPATAGEIAPAMSIEAWLEVMAPEAFASSHTQWPFGRTSDDAGVREMTSGNGPMPVDWRVMHEVEQRRLVELLERIGPAIVVAHSAGGPAGFLAGDARPELVSALVEVEPIGPPFLRRAGGYRYLAWGVASAPLTMDPPPVDPSDIVVKTIDSGGTLITLQNEPVRALTNLARIPIALVQADASHVGAMVPATAAFLRQAGCIVDVIRLSEHGVEGNGHAMMLELNNDEVLRIIWRWVNDHTTVQKE